MTRRLVKRMQRKAMGGTVYARVYHDGSVRVRTDHPSNDPAIEIAMAAVMFRALQTTFQASGLDLRIAGPLHWRDDPPKVSA
jgi:hypothetical protein